MTKAILTKGELVTYLSGIRGATFATITTKTDPKLLKTNNPYKDISKVSRVNVCIGFNYANSVNNQREREDSDTDFVSLPRKWGNRIPGTVLVEHKGSMYLETKIEKSLDHVYVNSQGQNIPEDLLTPFLPKRSGNERQELDKEILVRDYKIDSIIAMNVGGKELTII